MLEFAWALLLPPFQCIFMASMQNISFLNHVEDPALAHPLFSPKYMGKMTFIVFSDFFLSDVRRNGFLSSDINLSDQIGSFDTHIAIICAIFVI